MRKNTRNRRLVIVIVLIAVFTVGLFAWRFTGTTVAGTAEDWPGMRDSLAEEWSMYPAMNSFFDDRGRQIPLADDVRWEGTVSDLQWVIYAYGTAAFEPNESFNPQDPDEFTAWSSSSGRDPFRFPIDDEHPTDRPMHVKAQRATDADDGDELWVMRFPDDGVGCCYYYCPSTRKFMLHIWTL